MRFSRAFLHFSWGGQDFVASLDSAVQTSGLVATRPLGLGPDFWAVISLYCTLSTGQGRILSPSVQDFLGLDRPRGAAPGPCSHCPGAIRGDTGPRRAVQGRKPCTNKFCRTNCNGCTNNLHKLSETCRVEYATHKLRRCTNKLKAAQVNLHPTHRSDRCTNKNANDRKP